MERPRTSVIVRDGAFRLLGQASTMYVRTRGGGGRLRVLGYHDVPDPGLFDQQMRWLRRAMWPVPLLEGIEALAAGRSDPRATAITFDDGNPSIIDHALPVLERHGFEATAFICPALVDTSEPYWWQVVQAAGDAGLSSLAGVSWTVPRLKIVPDEKRRQVVADLRRRVEAARGAPIRARQLTSVELDRWIASGQQIGNHTWDHPMLDQSEQQAQRFQIRTAHEWLVDRFGVSDFFAFPNGNSAPASRAELESLGYRAAFLFDHAVARSRDLLAVSRIRINGADPLQEFKAKVSGLHPALHTVRSRFLGSS